MYLDMYLLIINSNFFFHFYISVKLIINQLYPKKTNYYLWSFLVRLILFPVLGAILVLAMPFENYHLISNTCHYLLFYLVLKNSYFSLFHLYISLKSNINFILTKLFITFGLSTHSTTSTI